MTGQLQPSQQFITLLGHERIFPAISKVRAMFSFFLKN